MIVVYFRVSAFVSRILHQALASEWSEDMFIPIDVVNKIALWLASQITETDDGKGYFVETSVIYDRSMQVGLL